MSSKGILRCSFVPKRSKISQEMAELQLFSTERLGDFIENQTDPWGVHLCQKHPKSVKKWLSYSYFSTERLRDFIENHMGPKGILGCSFVPKSSKIGQEMAELRLFSH